MKKIAVVTGTRAEFGLLRPLIQRIHDHRSLELQLYVTAMHLSPEFGMTVNEIEDSGLPITRKVESLLSSDSSVGIIKSMGLTMTSFAEALDELSPDMLIVLGDRTEIFSVVTAAYILGIPIAHLHGGETTEGAYDEAMRHSITKMSYWHFTSTEVYRKRVIQLGENPIRVFNFGAIGLDSIKELELLDLHEFEKSIDFNLGNRSFLVTYHPVTLNTEEGSIEFEAIFDAIENFKDVSVIITMPNSDKGGKAITKFINERVKRQTNNNYKVFSSLGQLRYLSALQHVSLVIGNSSSGIIEAPSFKIPTINIGDRQKGRFMPESVINCSNDSKDIEKAIRKGLSDDFKKTLDDLTQSYGKGNTSAEIIKVIETTKEIDLKKKFYDIP